MEADGLSPSADPQVVVPDRVADVCIHTNCFSKSETMILGRPACAVHGAASGTSRRCQALAVLPTATTPSAHLPSRRMLRTASRCRAPTTGRGCPLAIASGWIRPVLAVLGGSGG